MVSMIMPFALRILGLFVDKYLAKTDAQRKFYEFVDALASNGALSAKLRTEYDEQKQRLLKELDK